MGETSCTITYVNTESNSQVFLQIDLYSVSVLSLNKYYFDELDPVQLIRKIFIK